MVLLNVIFLLNPSGTVAPVGNTNEFSLKWQVISTKTLSKILDKLRSNSSNSLQGPLFNDWCCNAQFKKENVFFKVSKSQLNAAAGAKWPLSHILST